MPSYKVEVTRTETWVNTYEVETSLGETFAKGFAERQDADAEREGGDVTVKSRIVGET